jgi:dTDP-glucose 4,6-dehydratase
MDELLGHPPATSRALITFVRDRPGHDQRYAIDPAKLMHELNWRPSVSVDEGLRRTAQWYLDNGNWLEHVTSGAYRAYYDRQYTDRS